MAKKAKAEESFEVAPQEIETSVKTVQVQKEVKKPEWEIKDRVYFLKGHKPLTLTIPSKHTRRFPLLWFDQEKGEQLEIRYATNQNSPLVRDQKGEVTLGHIMFREGVLSVPKEKVALQKLLSIYHPLLNVKYYEYNPVQNASNDLEDIEIEIDALNLAREIDIDMAEAIMRVEVGSKVSKMSSREIKRDLMLFAKKNPTLFLQLANDENVHLRNVAIVATENGIIKLSQDQRTFTWTSTGRKLMNVPFDENPYSAMAAYFKTDEGTEVYKSIEKRLK